MAADVDDTLPEWSTTESSNKPTGSTAVGTNLDDNLRMIEKVVRGWLATKGSDIASATTTDLGAVEGLMHDITGTTSVTGFGTIGAGIWKIVKFEGALTLTHNATSLILPGGANITTADGDIGIFISEGSGNWRCVTYLTVATQALMEAGAALHAMVTPGRQHFHPGHPKAWGVISMSAGTPTLEASHNVTSIADTATGRVTVTLATDFADANYAVTLGLTSDGSSFAAAFVVAKAAGSFEITVRNSAYDAIDTYSGVSFICTGDFA